MIRMESTESTRATVERLSFPGPRRLSWGVSCPDGGSRAGTRVARAAAIIPVTLAHHTGPDHPPFFKRVSCLLGWEKYRDSPDFG
jgi:hypothetical protein